MGHLALSMQNQSKDVFPSDTKKNLKDSMVVTLRSGRELESRKENGKRMIDKEKKAETGEETKLGSSELVEETEKEEMQTEQQIEKGKLKKKEKVQAYMPAVPFPRGYKKQRWKNNSLDSWKCSRR